MIERLDPRQYRRQRWKNDGGETLEIAADAESAPPAWRLSLATIERDGPFSDFAGYDRTIVALEGAIRLSVDGIEVELRRHEPFEFRGESKVEASLLAGSVRDLNVMTRRSSFAHDVDVVSTRSVFLVDDDELIFVYVMEGSATVAHVACAAGETVYLDGEERLEVVPEPGATLCVARVTPR